MKSDAVIYRVTHAIVSAIVFNNRDKGVESDVDAGKIATLLLAQSGVDETIEISEDPK